MRITYPLAFIRSDSQIRSPTDLSLCKDVRFFGFFFFFPFPFEWVLFFAFLSFLFSNSIVPHFQLLCAFVADLPQGKGSSSF